ncbi:MAG: 2Fe-2S iron-sulfur cluster binding domain-containing protein [Crocinitomix sp.]|nr:2Fe-2S iron-sulfur cluster binding domain-containing protein [Crocinitomix sp.]
MSNTFFTLNVKNVNRLTADTVSVSFDLSDDQKANFNFIPGQYLTLKTTLGGEEVRRSYSICTAPYENEVAVAVKEIENGLFSTFANKTLKAGDQLEVMAPMGNFKITPNAENSKNYIFYAAGSGITPIISMVKSVLREEPSSNVQLYYGNKNSDSTIFKSQLDELNSEYINFNLNFIYSQQDTGNDLTNGRINAAKCERFFEKSQDNITIDGVYACGPEAMIMSIKDFYTDKGINKDKIHFELFTAAVPSESATEVASGEPVQSQVTVILDDETFEFSLNTAGKDILQAAQDQDADVPFSCKGGVCCTCRAKLIEGTVKMDLNFALEEDEVADGFILTCQSHPTSEKVVVSYDEY